MPRCRGRPPGRRKRRAAGSAEPARLRAERDTLINRIRQHPVMEQARAEGRAKEAGYTLQKATRQAMAKGAA